ncbi:hypothetical protein XAB3213_250008 [Xanthomonas citri pv. bilvae]|nr:hypothetical protein XAB3213_250008 [Xanthomonas citri pv. bilvae]
MGGGRAGPVRHPPGQPPPHRRLREVVRHRPGQGHDHLRRARKHRSGVGADRVEQAQGAGPPEEGRPHRAAGHRLGLELLDGGSGLVMSLKFDRLKNALKKLDF